MAEEHKGVDSGVVRRREEGADGTQRFLLAGLADEDLALAPTACPVQHAGKVADYSPNSYRPVSAVSMRRSDMVGAAAVGEERQVLQSNSGKLDVQVTEVFVPPGPWCHVPDKTRGGKEVSWNPMHPRSLARMYDASASRIAGLQKAARNRAEQEGRRFRRNEWYRGRAFVRGVTANGSTVVVHTEFRPTLKLEIPDTNTDPQTIAAIKEAVAEAAGCWPKDIVANVRHMRPARGLRPR